MFWRWVLICTGVYTCKISAVKGEGGGLRGLIWEGFFLIVYLWHTTFLHSSEFRAREIFAPDTTQANVMGMGF